MAQLIEIQRVSIGPRTLTARVRLSEDAPLMTSDDIEGTSRVYYLMPDIVEHTCLGDAGEKFRDVMGKTEVAHLLEHVTVELLAQTNIAGDVTSGRTFAVPGDARAFDIELSCPDDVLVSGALVSAVWLLQWAYTGGGEPKPDVAATVRGLVSLVESLPAESAGEAEAVPEPADEPELAGEPEAEVAGEQDEEPEVEDEPEPEPEPEEPEEGDLLAEEEAVPAEDAWDADEGIPAPHAIR